MHLKKNIPQSKRRTIIRLTQDYQLNLSIRRKKSTCEMCEICGKFYREKELEDTNNTIQKMPNKTMVTAV